MPSSRKTILKSIRGVTAPLRSASEMYTEWDHFTFVWMKAQNLTASKVWFASRKKHGPRSTVFFAQLFFLSLWFFNVDVQQMPKTRKHWEVKRCAIRHDWWFGLFRFTSWLQKQNFLRSQNLKIYITGNWWITRIVWNGQMVDRCWSIWIGLDRLGKETEETKKLLEMRISARIFVFHHVIPVRSGLWWWSRPHRCSSSGGATFFLKKSEQ